MTVTGYRFSVFPWTDTDLGGAVYYPLKPGYASTVMKFQGAELAHVVVFLDARGVPGAAYTAISRVSHLHKVLLAGALTPEHFAPAIKVILVR